MLCCVYLVCIELFGLCVIVCFEVGIYLLYLLLGLCIVSSLFQEYFGHFFLCSTCQMVHFVWQLESLSLHMITILTRSVIVKLYI